MKGILFRPDMLLAIQSGAKTQTRRLSGLKEINKEPDKWHIKTYHAGSWLFENGDGDLVDIKPRYQVGDIVCIKEAGIWDEKTRFRFYKANMPERQAKWVSPLFMPAWAARYFIKITGVGYERLQEITFKNCLAEGIVSTEQWLEMSKGDNYKPPEPLHPEDLSNEEADREIDRGWIEYTKQAYAMLWDSINPKFPWAGNWWVAVYSFVTQEKPNA